MRKSRDFVTAYELQQLPDNSAVMGHSGGSGDILDAMVVSAIQGGRINTNIILLGSPEKKEDFIRVGKDVGVKSVNMINHPLDPITNLPATGLSILGNAVVAGNRGGGIGTLGGFIGFSVGILGGIGVSVYQATKYHTFESYFNNPEFKLQQLIQNLLMRDVIKSIEEKGLSNEKE